MVAGDEYELVVAPERGWTRPLRVIGRLAVAAVALDDPVGATVGDYVVLRRADGQEILRVAGDHEGERATYDHLAGQLATLTVPEFREAWGITG